MNTIVKPSNISGEISAISSKSAAHRLLIASAFSNERTKLLCETVSEDILATADCLRSLGAEIKYENKVFEVHPKEKNKNGTLFCNESGTTLRLLLPIAAAIGGEWIFDMRGRLPERPLSPLKEELIAHGISFEYLDTNKLKTCGKLTCGTYKISGEVSSQFISGLLFALSLLDGKSTLEITGKLESEPYVNMTLDTLNSFGADVKRNGNIFNICGSQLSSKGEYTVEGDWSNSAFPLCAAAISKTSVTLNNLSANTRQGDAQILEILEKFGANVEKSYDSVTVAGKSLSGIEIDAKDIPDLVPIIAVVASLAKGTTIITGASRLRIKESDRLQTTYEMLTNLGADIKLLDDGFIINGKERLNGGIVLSHNDHRIAMCACVAALGCKDKVVIKNADAVKKSYPRFFEDMKKLGFNIEIINEGDEK